jgi:hypothetical protein
MRTHTALAVLLVALTVSPAVGQFGVRGGINLTKFIGDDTDNVESSQGLNLGGSFQLFTLGPIAIVPEVFYSQKGAEIEDVDGPSTPVQLKFSLDYLEVPVLARLNLPAVGMLNPYVAAGPAFAWQLSCELDVTDGGASEEVRDCGEQFGSVDTAFQDADRGLVVTGGIDLHVFGAGGLNLEARLVRGLARLNESDGGGEPDVRNQAVSLMLGYSFGL